MQTGDTHSLVRKMYFVSEERQLWLILGQRGGGTSTRDCRTGGIVAPIFMASDVGDWILMCQIELNKNDGLCVVVAGSCYTYLG